VGSDPKKFQALEKVAVRKLFQLYAARSLHDLRAPGNALEALKDDRAGQHRIRSTIATGCASFGIMGTHTTWR
jgi:toxin HigB-1